MGRIQSVKSLPKPVLDELNDKLIESSFSGYVELAAWLNDQGFSISKSAVHRYAVEHKTRLIAGQCTDETPPIEVRLRCLEAAVCLVEKNNDNSFTSQQVIREADNMLRWVYTS